MMRGLTFLAGVGLALATGVWYFQSNDLNSPGAKIEPELWRFSDARPLDDIYANEPRIDPHGATSVTDHAVELAGWNEGSSHALRPINPIRVAPANASDELPPELMPEPAAATAIALPRYIAEPEASYRAELEPPRAWVPASAEPLPTAAPVATISLAEQRYAELFGDEDTAQEAGNPLRGGFDAAPRELQPLSFESPSDYRPSAPEKSAWRDNPLRSAHSLR